MKQENLVNQVIDNNKLDNNDRAYISEKTINLLLKKIDRETQSRLLNYELRQKAAAFRQHLESSSEKNKIKIEEIDKHLLKGFLSYTSRLYKTGKISESAYVSLVTQATESYAEQLVELKIAKALKHYELYFEKIGIPWFL